MGTRPVTHASCSCSLLMFTSDLDTKLPAGCRLGTVYIIRYLPLYLNLSPSVLPPIANAAACDCSLGITSAADSYPYGVSQVPCTIGEDKLMIVRIQEFHIAAHPAVCQRVRDTYDVSSETMPSPGALRSLTSNDICTWAGRLRRAVPHDVDMALPPSIQAPDAVEAADALIFLVRWLFKDPSTDSYGSRLPFNRALALHVGERDVVCNLTTLGLLVSARGHWNIQIGEGIGRATMRTVLQLAVKQVLEDRDLWETRGRYSSILFHPSRGVIPARYVRLQVCRFLALLHMVHLHAGPEPISPFLIRAAIEERQHALALDAPFLRLLEPDMYMAVASWAERDRMTVPNTSPQTPIGQLLYAANINPRGLSANPTAAELQGIELSLISEMLLGDKDLSQHPDLEAFASGMSTVLAPGTSLRMIFDRGASVGGMHPARRVFGAQIHPVPAEKRPKIMHKAGIEPMTVDKKQGASPLNH
ncbi:hypothetical protein NUW54_g2161 [Trametes sanguinea]|uniref:Uncharacterized protein n=1 Tax=Trametes sanguinea TaxID=158606 RepID=A0ACC1Q6N3_9APHY|nr:hypothetical protein NUW54_g2161 [Trametes sanguinea]